MIEFLVVHEVVHHEEACQIDRVGRLLYGLHVAHGIDQRIEMARHYREGEVGGVRSEVGVLHVDGQVVVGGLELVGLVVVAVQLQQYGVGVICQVDAVVADAHLLGKRI